MQRIAAVSCFVVLFNVASVAALAKAAPKADNTAQNYGALKKDAVTAELENWQRLVTESNRLRTN
jgi:hypothetical protein